MHISDFNRPTEHPFDTFENVEIERFMWWFLDQCFLVNDLDAVIITPKNEDNLVHKCLLYKTGENQYRLTKKSKCLLYSFYGKEDDDKTTNLDMDLCINCGALVKMELYGGKCSCGNSNTVHQDKCRGCGKIIGIISGDDSYTPGKLYCHDCMNKARSKKGNV